MDFSPRNDGWWISFQKQIYIVYFEKKKKEKKYNT